MDGDVAPTKIEYKSYMFLPLHLVLLSLVK